MSKIVVVKVGGSLFYWPGLPGRLASFLRTRHGERLVLIAGGGRMADMVRDLDRVHGLGDERSHALALRSLDLTAHALATLVSGLDVVERPEDLEKVWQIGRIPVLLPRQFLDEDDRCSADPLPHSWDTTTDSIAARVACRINARELVLLKSASISSTADRTEAARLGLVDRHFPDVARTLKRVTYLCLRDPSGTVVELGCRLDDRLAPTTEFSKPKAALAQPFTSNPLHPGL